MEARAPVAGDRAEPRITTIGDGQYAQVVERRLIPPHVSSGSHQGRAASCPCRPLIESMTAVRFFPFAALGTRLDCRDQHDYRPWVTGVFGTRELELARCRFCEAVEVRDVSLDILPGISAGRGGPRRRSDVLGWYSGSRAAARTYR